MFVGEFLPSGGGGSPAFSPTLNLYQCFAAQVRPLSLQPAIGSPGISARISVFINVLPPGFRLSRQAAACNRLLEPALIRGHPDQSEALYGRPSLAAPRSGTQKHFFLSGSYYDLGSNVNFYQCFGPKPPIFKILGGNELSTVAGWSFWLPNIDSRPRLAPYSSLMATRTNPPALSLYQCFGRPSPRCDKRL